MKMGIKVVIAIALIIVFFVVYLYFVGSAVGESGSFLDNIWKGIESMIPF